MSPADLINGGFEAAGGVFILNHCRVLYRDKMVAGVSKLSTAVFFSWGIWNLYYYPSLDQWLSFAGGVVIVASNCLWLAMMIYYGRRPLPPREIIPPRSCGCAEGSRLPAGTKCEFCGGVI